jgi:hypothetical protein
VGITGGAMNLFKSATQYLKCFSQKTSIKKASDFSLALWELLAVRRIASI